MQLITEILKNYKGEKRNSIRVPLLLFFLFSTITLKSQVGDIFKSDTSSFRYTAGATFDFSYSSNCLTGDFMDGFLYGRNIDQDTREKVTGRSAGMNTLGGNLFYQVFFRNSHAKIFGENFGLTFSVGHNDLLELKIPFDMLRLYLYGNSRFAGFDLNLSDAKMNMLRTHFFKAGISKQFGKPEFANEAGITLGFLYAQENINVNVQSSHLYTELLGEYIDFSAGVTAQVTDTSRRDFWVMNGAGGSADLYWTFRKPHSRFLLQVDNIGFVGWNDRSFSFDKDTSIYFDGFEIEDIMKIDSTAFDGISNDSVINNFVYGNEKKKYTTVLPVTFSAQYQHDLGKKYLVTGALKYRTGGYFKPLVSIGAGYKLHTSVFAFSLSYGGYGEFNFGLDCLLQTLNKKHTIFFRTDFLGGWLLPEQSTAMGLSFTYHFNF